MSRYLYPFERRLIWENRRRWAIVVLIVYVILFLLDRWVFHGLYVGGGLHPLDAEAARTRLESRQWAMMFKGMGYLPLWLCAAPALGLARMADAGWRLAGAAAVSGGLAEILKPIVGRVRPHFTDGVHMLRHVPGVPDDQISYSMSSSHAGVAFGAAFMVLFLWGAPGWVALVLAFGCGIERMMAGAHFFTDIYVGAVIGYVVARLMQPGLDGAEAGDRAAMKLLDRYIARQYLINIGALLLILACFVVCIDVSLNMSRYWNAAVEYSKQSPSMDSGLRRVLITLVLVADLWWPRLLSLFAFLNGIVLIGAMGFTVTQLVRHRELVAVLTSGQSLFRVARPIVLVALLMTVVQAVDQELILPRIAPLLTREQSDAGKRTLGSTAIDAAVDGRGRIFHAAAFDADAGVMTDLSVWERDSAGIPERKIHAQTATWGDGAWNLEGVSVEGRRAGQRDVGATPTRIETDLDPTALKIGRFAGYGSNLSFAQARRMLASLDRMGTDQEQTLKMRDRLQRISLGRVSSMIANLLTLVIAMSFFLTREPQNMLRQSLKCAPVGIVSLIGAVLGTSATAPGVPTGLSVFIPVMVLLPVAIAMVSRVRS